MPASKVNKSKGEKLKAHRLEADALDDLEDPVEVESSKVKGSKKAENKRKASDMDTPKIQKKRKDSLEIPEKKVLMPKDKASKEDKKPVKAQILQVGLGSHW